MIPLQSEEILQIFPLYYFHHFLFQRNSKIDASPLIPYQIIQNYPKVCPTSLINLFKIYRTFAADSKSIYSIEIDNDTKVTSNTCQTIMFVAICTTQTRI